MKGAFRYVLDVATGGILLVAIFLLTRPNSAVRVAWETRRAATRMQAATERLWGELIHASAPLSGTAGSYDLVKVSDYDCPFCRSANVVVDSVLAMGVRVGYLHYPLRIHPKARVAAAAAICAEDQGRFAGLHQELMRDTSWHDDEVWKSVWRRAAVPDSARFVSCIEQESTTRRLDRHIALAESIGVRATPTFLSLHGVHQGTASVSVLLRLARMKR